MDFRQAYDSVRREVLHNILTKFCVKPKLLILPAALGPGVYSASNRNEYQKYKNNNV
jgi:hypothetical protein